MKIKLGKTRQAKSVLRNGKVVGKVAKQPRKGRMSNSLYRVLRGTPLNLANCRKADFREQQFGVGPLPSAVTRTVLVHGTHGVTVSVLPVDRNNVADLGDKRTFNLDGLKQVGVYSPQQAATRMRTQGAKLMTLEVGKKRERMTGYVLGHLDKMYLVFMDKKTGKFRTLETRSLPNGRNAHATFSVIK